MDFSGIVRFLKENSEAMLNSSMFSTDSIEGWICILLLGFMVWNLCRKAMKFVAWSVTVIFLFQTFYWLSFTGLNDYIPLDRVFKYDVLTSIAQCFAGTRVCDALLWANAWLQAVMFRVGELVFGGGFLDMLRDLGVEYPG